MKGTLTSEKKMNVREVADVFGVSDEAIKKHIRELFPGKIKNGVATYLSEEEVTAIKQKMRPTTKVAGTITDLEAAEMLIKSAEHFKTRFEQEHNARIKAEQKLNHVEAAFGREVLAHRETKTDLETYQRVAEEGGLMLNDRDDLLATSKR